MGLITNLTEFATLLHALLHNDRDVTIGVGGFTGEGKSTFGIQLEKEYSRIANMPWNFKNNCTWSRAEFLGWVDGAKKGKVLEPGLKPNQQPEFTALLLDELFSMFYKRNWHNDSQKEAIGTLNMCRDRHLLILGNVPLFWDLDGGFICRVRYYIYIPYRSKAWIFQQENNPFSSDPWNVQENRKRYRKLKSLPYGLPNFVAEINFPDLNDKEKEQYLNIRNTKRLRAQEDIKKESVERYTTIKKDRDNLIRAMNLKHKINQKTIKEYVSLKKSQVSNICLGLQ